MTRFLLHTPALLTAACLTAATTTARAEISAVLYDACSNAVTPTSPAFDQLEAAGWSRMRVIDDTTRSLLADGILASMATNRDTPMDWAMARPTAADLADTMLEVAEIGAADGYVIGDPVEAVLVVASLPNRDGYRILHCIAAANLSADFTSFADQLRAADQTAGVTQATPGLEIFNIRAQSRTETDPPKTIAVDATLGLFDPSATEVFPEPPRVGAGLSLYRYTQE